MSCALPELLELPGLPGFPSLPGLSEDAWRKSSYSSDANGSCVEWQRAGAAAVAVRDSKSPSLGAFRFTPGAWGAFLSEVKSGRFGG